VLRVAEIQGKHQKEQHQRPEERPTTIGSRPSATENRTSALGSPGSTGTPRASRRHRAPVPAKGAKKDAPSDARVMCASDPNNRLGNRFTASQKQGSGPSSSKNPPFAPGLMAQLPDMAA